MKSKNWCACGSNKAYEDCCGVAHDELSKAVTAEQLMRSRFTAFAMANGDYLMNSHHESTRSLVEKEEIVDWAKSVKWLRLEVLSRKDGMASDKEGFVEFKAYYKEGFKMKYIHENSKFVKERGCWYYLGIVDD